MKKETMEMIHQIRNHLGPIQTFLDVVDTKSNPQLHTFQKTCVESLNALKELLDELEEEQAGFPLSRE